MLEEEKQVRVQGRRWKKNAEPGSSGARREDIGQIQTAGAEELPLPCTAPAGLGQRLYGEESGRWLMAGAVSLLILVCVFLWKHPVFMTIDDTRLKYVYAGFCTGEPEGTYLFNRFPLGNIVAGLYRLLPGVSWYAIYQFFLIWVGSTIIGKTIYKISYSRSFPVAAAVAVHVLLYLTLCLVATIMMHFEVTAILIGTAGVALLLGVRVESDRRNRLMVDLVLAALCCTVTYTMLRASFFAVCYPLAVVLLYHVFRAVVSKEGKETVIWLGFFLLLLAVLVCIVTVEENAAKSSPEWMAYRAYNKYRIPFWDYPHTTYAEAPAMFQELGWTRNFYNLAQKMYFMDERFNQEALEHFISSFSWLSLSDSADMRKTAVDTISKLVKDEPLVLLQFLAIQAVLLAVIIRLCARKSHNRKATVALVAAICCVVGSGGQVIFLAIRGRLPLRAWLTCAIPAGTTATLLLLSGLGRYTGVRGKKRWATAAVSLAMLALWGLGMVNVYREFIEIDWEHRRKSNEVVLEMEDYAIAHPENIYVYDLYGAQNYNVFSEYSPQTGIPINAVIWGGSYVFTPTYYKQLAALGREKLLTEDLFEENVYYITGNDDTYRDLLRAMLTERYPQLEMKKVDAIGDELSVYKLRK